MSRTGAYTFPFGMFDAGGGGCLREDIDGQRALLSNCRTNCRSDAKLMGGKRSPWQ